MLLRNILKKGMGRPVISKRLYSDRITVDPLKYDENETKDFFRYQTGRWLVNDPTERDARTTKFNIKGLLEVLHGHSGTPDVSVETIEPWYEGKHNKLYRIQLQDRRSYMLRIPYGIVDPEYRRLRLLSEVATMDFARERCGIKVPSTLAYSGTSKNELGTPYILMDFVVGTKLAEKWDPAAEDVETKMPVLEATADLAAKLLGPEFDSIGSIYFAADMSNETTFKIDDRYVIGPSTEKRFWRSPAAAEFRGPWKTTQQYLQATADVQLAYVDAALAADPENTDLKLAHQAAQRYAKVSNLLCGEAEVAKTGGLRLCHPDLGPLNVITQENGTHWVYDFENASVKPYVFHGVPWFVRCPHERIYSVNDVPQYEKMPEIQQRVVRHIVSLTQSEFTYEKLLIQKLGNVVQAHHPNMKRREEVVRAVMSTDMDRLGFYNDVDFAVFKLVHMWPILGITKDGSPVDCPVQFSDAEVAQIEESVTKWNQYLMKHRFLESKNFVGVHEFEQLLGDGKLVPKGNGDYELTPKFYETQTVF